MPKILSSPAQVVQPVKGSTQPAAAPIAAPAAQQNGAWQPKPAGAPGHHTGVGGFFKKIGDELANGAAKSIGYLELAGLRYPVSQYSAKVSDTLTRGSRVTDGAKGYQSLHDQGFKSVIDLTAEGTDDKVRAAKAGLNTMQVPTIDNSPPTIAQMREMLNFIQAPANQPAYIHCEAGRSSASTCPASSSSSRSSARPSTPVRCPSSDSRPPEKDGLTMAADHPRRRRSMSTSAPIHRPRALPAELH